MTSGFLMNHVMIRVRDPKPSLHFYLDVLGMKLLNEYPMPKGKFTNYFVGYVPDGVQIPQEEAERFKFVSMLSGVIELCHNWGTETDPEFKGYHNGNSDPRGFGHLAISVPDMDAAVKRFEELGVPFQKRPNDGMMRGIAFIRDPDNYWIELVCPTKAPWIPDA